MTTKPTVTVIVGLPTTGKSTLGRALAEASHLLLIDIDDGPAQCTVLHPQPVESDEDFDRVRQIMRVRYHVLMSAIEANLREGISHIAIATFSRRENQNRLRGTVARAGGTLRIVWCQYDDTDEEVERRINERVQSGATGGVRSVKHYRNSRDHYEGIELPHLVVRMDHGVDLRTVVKQVRNYIDQ